MSCEGELFSCSQLRMVETVTRSAPLGLELIDAASGRRVGDGLIVRVAPVGRPQRVVGAGADHCGGAVSASKSL